MAALFTFHFSAFAAALPEHIAVLPIQGDATPEDLKELRVTFFNHIGSKNYRDMELGDVDSKIYVLEQQTGKKWQELEPNEVAQALGVEGLIYLNVVGVDKLYMGLYSSLSVSLEVSLVEAATGRIVWKKTTEEVNRAGGLPMSPWAAISTAVQSALVLRDSVKIEIFDKLCRKISKEIPEPEKLGVEKPLQFSL